jgi:hypothetical protein
MGDVIVWILVAISVTLAFVSSIAFRRGDRRFGLELYRRSDQPALFRNLPIVMPLLSVAIAPVVAILIPIPISLSSPRWLMDLVFFGTGSYAFLVIGTVLVLLYRPPRWLVPRWLAEDDRRSGYRPPAPDLFDRAWLVVGVLFMAGGLLLGTILIGSELGL